MPLGRPRNEAEKAVDAAHARRRRAARREALEEAKNATDPTPEQQETLRIVREKLEKDVGRKTASRQRQREENEAKLRAKEREAWKRQREQRAIRHEQIKRSGTDEEKAALAERKANRRAKEAERSRRRRGKESHPAQQPGGESSRAGPIDRVQSGTDIDAEGESVSEEALTDSDVDAEGEYDSELDAEGEWDPDHEPEQGPTHQMQHSFAKLRLGLRQSQIYRQSHTRHRSLF